MKSTVFRRVETADVLANAVTALETLKDASAAVGTVPFLGVLFGSALGLIRTVETVRADRERTIRFVRRLSELVEHVDRSIAAHTGAPDDKLESSLAELQSALMRMQKDLEALAKERFLSRFLRRGSISGRLQEHLETLDHVSRSFNIACLIALQAAMNWNAEFDDQQMHLFRFSDLTLHRSGGRWHVHSGISGEEWSGEWQGNTVTIRILRPEQSTELNLTSVIRAVPQCNYPYVTRIFGRSHPSISQKFYVLERGPMSVNQYVASINSERKLCWYLQMYIDYEETINYLRSMNFPVTRIGEAHKHSHCLSSLTLKGDGTLLLYAGDLVGVNMDCLAQAFRNLFTDDNVAFEDDDSQISTIAQNPRALLSVLQRNTDRTKVDRDIEQLYSSGPETGSAEIWTYSWYRTLSGVSLGDFGYLDRQTDLFVNLGNVSEVLGKEYLSYWYFARYCISSAGDYVAEEINMQYTWTDRVWRYSPAADKGNMMNIAQQSCRKINAIFFWYLAYDIAEAHQIALSELILVDTIACAWEIEIVNVPSVEALPIDTSHCEDAALPEDIYFHQSPLSENGAIPSPAGYWSLTPEPLSGPLQELPLPGLSLDCRTRVKCAGLNSLQAELISYFGRELQRL